MIGTLYASDAGREVIIPVLTGSVVGTTVTSAVLGVTSPVTGTSTTWTVSIASTTTTQVNLRRITTGTDITEVGLYKLRAWLYAGASLVGVTDVGADFRVLTAPVRWSV